MPLNAHAANSLFEHNSGLTQCDTEACRVTQQLCPKEQAGSSDADIHAGTAQASVVSSGCWFFCLHARVVLLLARSYRGTHVLPSFLTRRRHPLSSCFRRIRRQAETQHVSVSAAPPDLASGSALASRTVVRKPKQVRYITLSRIEAFLEGKSQILATMQSWVGEKQAGEVL